MSWELMSDEKRICACGKGFVVERHYMDDWNRTREERFVECKYCKEQQLKERNRREEMRSAFDKIVSYFNEKYLDQWIAYFKDKISKKSIWETVHSIGLENCSLSTFYSDHRSHSIEEMNGYYKSLVKIKNITKIIQILDIKDEVIENELPELLNFYEEQERKSYNEAYAQYRKKI